MFDGEVFFVGSGEQQHVELQFVGELEELQVGISGTDKPVDFLLVDYLGYVGNFMASCLHFDNDDSTVFFRDDVDFVSAASPIAFADEIAFFEKRLEGYRFSFLSENVVCCHKSITEHSP